MVNAPRTVIPSTSVPALVRRPQIRYLIDVLENFRYSCAFCGFHAVLNGVATGIDAAHVHWHSLHGPDDVENGIALCKAAVGNFALHDCLSARRCVRGLISSSARRCPTDARKHQRMGFGQKTFVLF